MEVEDNIMEQDSFQKRARVLNYSFSDPEFSEAVDLLRDAGYIVVTIPVEGSPLEIYVYPTEDRDDARRLSLQQLKKFLRGEKIPRSMWTIV